MDRNVALSAYRLADLCDSLAANSRWAPRFRSSARVAVPAAFEQPVHRGGGDGAAA